MGQQQLNVGTAPDASDGDDLRSAMQAVNANFSDLYGITGSLPSNQGAGSLDALDVDSYGIPGMTVRSVTTAGTNFFANRILYFPWVLPYPITLKSIRCHGSNSSSASVVRQGICKADANTGAPVGMMWQDSVTVPLTTPADRDISSIDVDLEPGFYYLLSKADQANTTMVTPYALTERCHWQGGTNGIFFGLYNSAGPTGAFADPVPTPTDLTVGADATKGLGLPFLMQWDSRAPVWS